jgi:hypothetical protein
MVIRKISPAAQQLFMFHYRVYGPALLCLVMRAQDDLANN